MVPFPVFTRQNFSTMGHMVNIIMLQALGLLRNQTFGKCIQNHIYGSSSLLLVCRIVQGIVYFIKSLILFILILPSVKDK